MVWHLYDTVSPPAVRRDHHVGRHPAGRRDHDHGPAQLAREYPGAESARRALRDGLPALRRGSVRAGPGAARRRARGARRAPPTPFSWGPSAIAIRARATRVSSRRSLRSGRARERPLVPRAGGALPCPRRRDGRRRPAGGRARARRPHDVRRPRHACPGPAPGARRLRPLLRPALGGDADGDPGGDGLRAPGRHDRRRCRVARWWRRDPRASSSQPLETAALADAIEPLLRDPEPAASASAPPVAGGPSSATTPSSPPTPTPRPTSSRSATARHGASGPPAPRDAAPARARRRAARRRGHWRRGGGLPPAPRPPRRTAAATAAYAGLGRKSTETSPNPPSSSSAERSARVWMTTALTSRCRAGSA